ncbi:MULTISPECIES: L-aspartate oxidase [unclassified Modicisalibacter]|uniref:L-aspartate oxidase n=1 Tax=unclassified Modicisalibacter TaxID=2679913 RepID=UPI001CCAEFA8|nr:MULTISPECIES: L-aspartate oxidase [unclassified Modicisalibacter]MBZ9560295.1 L-aspartate oxidase [Modicisalibacter sp. R2A 31.J]MBZ9576204.1 L-aspartate oxidase [Modicisalibacter sp. MOD 31.J]
MTRSEHDVLVVGGGVAGLTLALELADHRQVTLLRPVQDDIGASRWAQGGIAAVLDPRDAVEDHVQDTLIAGDGLCDEEAVRFTVTHSTAAIEWLVALGVPFTPDPTPDAPYPFHLTREGGHGTRRIIHAADATGQALIETLLERVFGDPRIQVRDDLQAIELLADAQRACCGALCLDAAGNPVTLAARDVVLATGGASGLFRHTTSPAPACGEGMAMAAALGATLMNLEFQQFHPTCLYDPAGAPFLISEAVRGEGGRLRDIHGRAFMTDYDSRAELAPRDVVARAIHAEMQRTRASHVLLDVTHLPAAQIAHHFPTIQAHCQSRGLDITRQPIPVVPAAHYSCGGVATDLNGASDVPHLYAIGEVACTGLHGANRMASNSLLECLVFARAAARALREDTSREIAGDPATHRAGGEAPMPPAEANAGLQELRSLMSAHAGIVRHDAGMDEGLRALEALAERYAPFWRRQRPSVESARLHHATRLAILLMQAARRRRESRGLHYNRDCPDRQPGPARASRSRLAPPE